MQFKCVSGTPFWGRNTTVPQLMLGKTMNEQHLGSYILLYGGCPRSIEEEVVKKHESGRRD
jgi:hypothetical protein